MKLFGLEKSVKKDYSTLDLSELKNVEKKLTMSTKQIEDSLELVKSQLQLVQKEISARNK